MRRRPSAAAGRVAVPRVAVPLLVALLASVVGFGAPAGAASGSSVDQLREQRRAVQQKRAAQAAQINVLKSSDKQLTQALDALESNRRTQQAAVTAARQRSEAESARAVQARAAEAATTRELDDLRNSVRRLAVDEFIRGGSTDEIIPTDLSQPMESARRRALLSAAVGRSADATDRLHAAQEDLQLQRRTAESAAAAAAAEQQKVEQHLSELTAATKQQQALADQVEAKLEHALAEADALSSLDSGLAARITAGQAALVRRLRTAPGAGRTAPGTSRRVGAVSLSTVRGITVASSIAGKLAQLLDAADAGGLSLSGGGYRDPSQQAALRRAHCGSSDYDVYDKPASQCHPPTARPGQSMHEQGLAIDFTNNGSIISRSSPAYRWLRSNAGRYGLHNLPSEPWHWSVNGD